MMVGSPIQCAFPSPEIQGLLKALPALEGLKVVTFDARTKRAVFGYAARRVAKSLERKGHKLLAPPEVLLILGIEGTLVNGELERAIGWAKKIIL